MGVQINIPTFLLQRTNGVKTAIVNGNTVGDCLNHFVKQFPLTKELLFKKNGRLFGHIEIFVNGVSTFPDELNKPVEDGDAIFMQYLISGG